MYFAEQANDACNKLINLPLLHVISLTNYTTYEIY